MVILMTIIQDWKVMSDRRVGTTLPTADTAILKTGKQTQRITTADGYVFGLSIKSGLA